MICRVLVADDALELYTQGHGSISFRSYVPNRVMIFPFKDSLEPEIGVVPPGVILSFTPPPPIIFCNKLLIVFIAP
jgi:hypothetical protein